MTAKDKEFLDRCYQKCIKGSKAKKQEIKVKKVIKEKAIDKVNRKLAEKGTPITFGSGAKETDRETALRIAPDLKASPKEGIIMHAGTTRAELMAQCKAKGVKNYRVLNKQEMTDILADIGNQKHIDEIVAGAVQRWKSGWGKEKKQ